MDFLKQVGGTILASLAFVSLTFGSWLIVDMESELKPFVGLFLALVAVFAIVKMSKKN